MIQEVAGAQVGRELLRDLAHHGRLRLRRPRDRRARAIAAILFVIALAVLLVVLFCGVSLSVLWF